MNRLGMIVDMSHIAHTTMRKVLDVTKAPVCVVSKCFPCVFSSSLYAAHHSETVLLRTWLGILSVEQVIFSHSSVFSICKNQRNVPDDVIQRIPANGGVIMVNFWPSFVSCSSNATLSQVADHIGTHAILFVFPDYSFCGNNEMEWEMEGYLWVPTLLIGLYVGLLISSCCRVPSEFCWSGLHRVRVRL